MRSAPTRVALPGSAQWMISSLEGRVREVAEQVTAQVRSGVPGLDSPADGRLLDLVFTAVHNAMRVFVDEALGREVSYLPVEDMFRKVGYRVALRGRDLETIDQGMGIAVGVISDELRVRAAENELSAGALNAINDAVTGFVAQLTEQVRVGYRAGAEARSTDTGLARARLLAALLSGADDDEVEAQAAIAGWEVPEQLTVIAVDTAGEGAPTPDALGPKALTRPGRTPQPVVCATADADEVVAALRRSAPKARASVCWPVPRGDATAAWTWATRALALVEARVIPARPVIECVRFRTEIWLHAEPVLRRQLAQELLQPLFNETENSREILSETLLVWLETRDSAPAIAARLGVHPQTVRYRWKRINELFGDSLHDPDFVIQLTLLLKASVPLWIAGDQSDFRRFREQEETG
ncbi:helix-turn-helix domain-containing protein [Nocardioides sp. R1-1]|uniref:PucR family transcriptional regulator n=1 Tax=Nocardioides sp. R1-1 TaxID=3383502 RepID=UPI0038D153F4